MANPKPYDVAQYGTDTSARPILLNARMKLAVDMVVDRLGFTPTIVQGAYMARLGGGADASAGYHDQGGCIDFRIWDLTAGQVKALNHAWRSVAGPGWVRNEQHGGFDPHYHCVVDGDKDAAWGALDQMRQYRDGLDGLSDRGPDYMWRPNPIPPPIDYYTALREFELSAQDVKDINAHTDDAAKAQADRVIEVVRSQGEIAARQRARALAAIEALPDTALTKKDVRAAVEKALADEATGGTP